MASWVVAGGGELIDLAAYRPLRRRNRLAAVAASGAVDAVVDSAGFLALAGFPITPAAIGGQLPEKAVWVTSA